MRSVHTINLICRAERLSESNYGVMQQKDEGAAGGGGEAVGRIGRINSIRCRHTCLMYMHIIHGCDATFLCGLPPAHGVARRPFTNIPAGIRTADSP